MFEKLIEAVLAEYVSEWIEGIDIDNMKIGIFSGKVEFHDLRLNVRALNKLQFPMQIIQASVGSLKIKVPWKRLRESAVKIVMDDIFILAEPSHGGESSSSEKQQEISEKYETRRRWAKQQEVRVREILEKTKNDDASAELGINEAVHSSTTDTTANWGFRDKIIHNVIDNVSLELRNIHFRFEDINGAISSGAMAFGCVVESIVVQTTNANGHVTFVDRAQSHTPFLHKCLEVKNGSIYCITGMSVPDLLATRSAELASPISISDRYNGHHVIHPIHLTIKLTINHDETTCFSIPRFQFSTEIDSIRASLSPSQCNDLVCLVNFVSAHENFLKRVHIRRKRPKRCIKGHAKSWWQYAFFGVGVFYSLPSHSKSKIGFDLSNASATGLNPRKCTWKLFIKLWFARKEYIILQKQMLRTAMGKSVPESIMSIRNQLFVLEDELDVDTIVFFRLCAREEFKLEDSRQNSGKKISNWRSKWKGHVKADSRKENIDSDSDHKPQLDLSRRIDIYTSVAEQMIRTSSKEPSMIAKREDLLFTMDAAVSSMTLSLVSVVDQRSPTLANNTREFIRVEVNQLVLAHLQRRDAYRVSFNIQRSQIIEYIPRSQTIQANILQNTSRVVQPLMYALPVDDEKEAKVLFRLAIDSSQSKLILSCSMLPFRMIYNMNVIRRLESYFSAHVKQAVPILKENASEALNSSSSWMKNTIIKAQPAQHEALALTVTDNNNVRRLEFSVNLSRIEILVLSNMVSPIVELCFHDLHLFNKAITDNFVFSIKTVQMFFISSLQTAMSPSKPTLQLEDKDNDLCSVTSRILALEKRSRSVVLKKTKFLLEMAVIRQIDRSLKYYFTCTLPPLFLALSREQYYQVLQASNSWKDSNRSFESESHSPSEFSLKKDRAISSGIGAHDQQPLATRTNETADESICIKMIIPDIYVVLEGVSVSQNAEIVNLLFQLQQINLEIKGTSPPNSILLEFEHFLICKQVVAEALSSQVDQVGKRTKCQPSLVREFMMTSQAKENEDREGGMDQAPDTNSLETTSVLLEVQQNSILVNATLDPLKIILRVNRVIVHWDHRLIFELFRSYRSQFDGAKDVANINSIGSGFSIQSNSCEYPLRKIVMNIDIANYLLILQSADDTQRRLSFRISACDLRGLVTSGLVDSVTAEINIDNSLILESYYHVIDKQKQAFGIIQPDALTTRVSNDHETYALLRIDKVAAKTDLHISDNPIGTAIDPKNHINLSASNLGIHYIHGHICALFDHLQDQFSSFYVATGSQSSQSHNGENNMGIGLSIQQIKVEFPRGALSNTVEKESKPEKLHIKAAHARLSSHETRTIKPTQQYRIDLSDIDVSTYVPFINRPHTDAVASLDEATERTRVTTQTDVEENRLLKLPSVYVHISFDEEDDINAGVLSELQQKCKQVQWLQTRVSLSSPEIDSTLHSKTSLEETNEVIDHHEAEPVVICLDDEQIQLFVCLIEENFSVSSCVRAEVSHNDEALIHNVEFMVGDICFRLLEPLTRHSEEACIVDVPRRVISEFDFADVRMKLCGYSTFRQEYQITCSNSQIWLLESLSDEMDRDGLEIMLRKMRCSQDDKEMPFLLCADIFVAKSESETIFDALSITLNTLMSTSAECTPSLEIKTHISAVAITPMIVRLIGASLPVFYHTEFLFREIIPKSPVNFTLTTGIMHILLSRHIKSQARAFPNGGDSDDRDDQSDTREGLDNESEEEDGQSLLLIASGCFIVRFCTSTTSCSNIQIFGRKVSMEVSRHWPPQERHDDISLLPSEGTLDDASRDNARLLCQDITLDVDVSNQTNPGPQWKISVALTNINIIICHLDLLMLLLAASVFETEYKKHHAMLLSHLKHLAPPTLSLNISVEDISCSYVRDIGEYFLPMVRCYFSKINMVLECMHQDSDTLSRLSTENGKEDDRGSSGETKPSKNTSAATIISIFIYFIDAQEGFHELEEEEGCSFWGFNSVLGAWEPILEPWMFTLTLQITINDRNEIADLNSQAGIIAITISFNGGDLHPLNINFSPFLLDTMCRISKEMQQFKQSAQHLALTQQIVESHISTASVISSGFYLGNDCGIPITFSLDGNANQDGNSGRSRVLSYERENRHSSLSNEVLQLGRKVPLKLPTAISPTKTRDHTFTFSLGEDEAWLPVRNINVQSVGNYVYTLRPTNHQTTRSSQSGDDPISKAHIKPVQMLLEISTALGYRNIIISSTVRVYNDNDTPLSCGVIVDRANPVLEFGIIEPHGFRGIPLTVFTSTSDAIRLVARPYSGSNSDTEKYRWSNEIILSTKSKTVLESSITSPLMLSDYTCQCQRILDGSKPLHLSQSCKANGCYLKYITQTYSALSPGCNGQFTSVRLQPPLSFENMCPVTIYFMVFVYKKLKASTGQDRGCFHLVSSEKVEPHGKLNLTDASLTEETFCSISITGYNWSKLFLLYTAQDLPNTSSAFTAAANFLSSPMSLLQNTPHDKQQPSGLSTRVSSPTATTAPKIQYKQTLCTMQDFHMRIATLNVIQPSRAPASTTTQKVIIQPKFVIRNETLALPLHFEPCDLNRMKSPQAVVGVAVKSMFNLATSTFGLQNKPTTKLKTVDHTDHHESIKFIDAPRLEFLHAKLNSFNNSQVSTRSTAKRLSISGSTRKAEAQNTTLAGDHLLPDPDALNTSQDAYYVSSTNLINVGLENSNRSSHAVHTQLNLEAALGGSSKSLRVLDESNQQWKDLTVRLNQVDTWGMTNVTFYERYIFANHTDHELLCCSSQGIRSGRQDAPSFFSLTDKTNQAACTGTLISCHACTPFHWISNSIPTDFCVRLLKLSAGNSPETWRWSGKFSLHDIGEAAIKLTSLGSDTVYVIRVEVRAGDSGQIFVLLTSEETDHYPLYRIINSVNDVTLYIKQSFAGGTGDLTPATEDGRTLLEYNRGVRQILASGESLCFGWDEAYFLHPLERKILLSFSAMPMSELQLEIAIDQPNQTHSFTLPPRGPNQAPTIVYVYWYLNSVTKTIHIHNTHLEYEQLTGKQIARLSPLATHFLQPKEEGSGSSTAFSMLSLLSQFTIQLHIPNTTISFISSKPEEVLLATMEKLSLHFTRHFDDNDQLEIKIAFVQLDNQLENAVLPVLLTPLPTDSSTSYHSQSSQQMLSNTSQDASASSRSNRKAEKEAPHFHFSLLKLSYGEEVDYIKYMAVMFQPTQIQADDYLLLSLAAIVTETIEVLQRHYPAMNAPSSLSSITSELSKEAEISDLLKEKVLVQHKQNRRMYIESMQLHPIKVQITFQQNNLTDALGTGTVATAVLENRAAAIVVLPVLLLILRANLVNIDAAALHLNALHIDHSFSSLKFMLTTIKRHYSFQTLLQMYALIGSADILGNPIGLVTNLGTGVRDFFYEPAVGMVKSPQDFVVGLSRGTASLVKNSIYGTFNAASRFTGTLSSGIASLSLDHNYISERNTRLRREVATHVGTGLLYGTKQLGHGIFDGVSGVLTAPVLGAYSNGLGGFVEGLGKGLIGVAVKPTAGILDLASRTTAGITATATVFDKKARSTRSRLPRMMQRSDQRLRIYSIEESFVASILQRLLHTKRTGFETEESYRAHVLLPTNRIFVVTTHHCMYIEWNTGNLLTGMTLNGGLTFRLVWKHQVDALDHAELESKGVQILFQFPMGAMKPASITTANATPPKILIPFRSEDRLYADRLVKCISNITVNRVQG
uniref:Vacuolar protein sortingassociated protein putative n=1 Tax=Albugo laibachii Nc14 TaxID=890382 RepID=F0WR91_9STRA|nr:vacuolar protein sortingassociated protein putative [Albugo laibachii Nc14]CCA24037.1 vacuolar protein sortingassociated protein putative [Albugo laibachii Nc14]|eukprot:CCA24037.1 vacuolar protein sortingassociated protein putative [Albugo laibachii Nc14]